MKTIKFISFLFYRYYSTGATKSIPYFSTLCALAMLIGLHIFQLVVLFNATNLLPVSGADPGMPRLMAYFKWALITSPLFIGMLFLIKKSELQSMHYDESKIKRGYVYLIIYIVLSVALLILLSLYKKGKLG